ncbi:MAG TPA: malonyl-CoA decarboxylase [Ferrovibrio sp.]|jgi:malonyl-CoA decarboxylase|uniref:malonyl-CoA decarboxylase n=1 Tax=Ferrovibrio sp. TaxID=1917215 RepID=UPI002B4AF479|nr:malonyl-CoA decarboxylase [Ferrovibrio sp.]HLT79285.1 malonyl-CoA decarboxylase [Ferrovibrio sp.]
MVALPSIPVSRTLLERGLRGLVEAWRGIAGGDRVPVSRDGTLEPRDVERLRSLLNECLEARGGEVSARARAATLGQLYLDLSDEGKRTFLQVLATGFAADAAALDKAIAEVQAATDPAARHMAERRLRQALTPPRQRLLTQFTSLPQGVKFLVDMRADALRFRKEAPELAILDADLEDIFVAWFDVGFLELKRITWNSPAALLEKLIAYEAVHAIESWDDLRNRLDADRRCYAFFHPRMPLEPLIFVEVALVKGIAGNVQALLDQSVPVLDAKEADTAIFYSISNTQVGLRGISFGNFLIKRVVDDLSRDLPNLKTFSTLSPIPGFRKWLDEAVAKGTPDLVTAEAREALGQVLGKRFSKGQLPALLKDYAWVENRALADTLRPVLMRLGARYLLTVDENGRPRDPVARFHLSNGASVHRLNWLGDRSRNGLKQAAGLMVNYLYRLDDIDQNHERFVRDGTIAASAEVRRLADL